MVQSPAINAFDFVEKLIVANQSYTRIDFGRRLVIRYYLKIVDRTNIHFQTGRSDVRVVSTYTRKLYNIITLSNYQRKK